MSAPTEGHDEEGASPSKEVGCDTADPPPVSVVVEDEEEDEPPPHPAIRKATSETTAPTPATRERMTFIQIPPAFRRASRARPSIPVPAIGRPQLRSENIWDFIQ